MKVSRELIEKQCRETRLTIYDVKYLVVNAPYFFARKTMKFFNQTLRDYHVNKTESVGVYYVWAIGKGLFSHSRLKTERWFNAFDNKFYFHYLDAVHQAETFTINNKGE